MSCLLSCTAQVPGEPSQSATANLENAAQDATGATIGSTPLVDLNRLETALTQSPENRDGAQSTLPPALPPTLPPVVGGKMLATAVQEQAVPLEQLKIMASRPRQWQDGCLGIFSPDELCIQVITPGWQGVVSDGNRDWVYHSDELGEVVKLNRNASETGARIHFSPLAQGGQLDASILSFWLSSWVPPKEGGAARAWAILIHGSLVELDASGFATGERRALAAGQIQAFDQQRNQARLAQFNGLRYGSPRPAAEQIRVSLVDSQGIVQYDPAVKAQLPPDLQALNSAWEAIACFDSLADCVSSDLSPTQEAVE